MSGPPPSISDMQSYVNIRCHLETFQALSTNFGDNPRTMLINTYPRFPPFYYSLGANLVSLLHGNVSVKLKERENIFKSKEMFT